MKILLSLLVMIALASSSVSFAESTNASGKQLSSTNISANTTTTFYKGTELLGKAVENANHEKLGGVQDLVLDLSTGRLVYVVLAAGGFLGIGDKLIAIPPTAVSGSASSDLLLLDADKEALRAAPSFSRAEDATGHDPQRAGQAYAYFRAEPLGPGAEIHEAAGAEGPQKSGREPSAGSAETKYWRASDLIGRPVQTPDLKRIGDVQDVAIDLPSGKIRYAVLAVGGFFGIGEKLFAVGPEVLTFRENGSVLVLGAAPDAISRANAFDENTWPSNADAAFAPNSQSRGSHASPQTEEKRIQESAGATRPTNRPNTATLTASDQSSEPRDVQLTRSVRRAVMADDALSFSAKNIQIITVDGEVTLRGEVEDTGEKESVLQKAEDIAGPGHVADHLRIPD